MASVIVAAGAVIAGESESGTEASSTHSESQPLFPQLERLLADAYVTRGSAWFTPPTDEERERFRQAFASLLAEAARPGALAPPPSAAPSFGELGFEVETVPVAGQTLWAVLEHRHRQRGGGMYLVRPGPDAGPWTAGHRGAGVTRTVVMAPHPRSDKGTDLIGQRLFALGQARAFLQATVHRKTSAPDGTLADPAHRPDTYFQAATDALDAATDRQLFIQLHGFETAHHDLGGGVGVVASDGTGAARPGTLASAALRELAQRHPGPFITVHGEKATRLGGTKNVQARAIVARGRNAFLHLEIAAKVRGDAVRASSGATPAAGSFLDSLIGLTGRAR